GDVVRRPWVAGTGLRKRMPGQCDHAPAGAGKADRGGVADAAARAREQQRPARNVGGGHLGIEPRLGPRRIGRRTPEYDAVVQAERAVVPELELERRDAPAAPARRPRYLADEMFRRDHSDRLFEREAALQRLALLCSPGASMR